MNDHEDKNASFSSAVTAALAASDRIALRRIALQQREGLPADHRMRAARRVNDELWQWLSALPVAMIGFCAPIRAEVDCRPAVLRLIAAGWQACMPVVVEPQQPMQFRRWRADTVMTTDPHGIPVPAEGECPPPAVLLLPLVAYDAAGYRLGYGGGYFDRTLAACHPRPLTIGIGYAATRLASMAPAPHDIPLDAVLSDAGLERFAIARAGDPLAFPAIPAEDAVQALTDNDRS